MTRREVLAWLAARRPVPPDALRGGIEAVVRDAELSPLDPLPDRSRDELRVLRPVERGADHDPRRARRTGRTRHVRGLGRRGAAGVDQHQQTGTPLEQSAHGSLPAMRSASPASPVASASACASNA